MTEIKITIETENKDKLKRLSEKILNDVLMDKVLESDIDYLKFENQVIIKFNWQDYK